jgi:hypothetical protein
VLVAVLHARVDGVTALAGAVVAGVVQDVDGGIDAQAAAVAHVEVPLLAGLHLDAEEAVVARDGLPRAAGERGVEVVLHAGGVHHVGHVSDHHGCARAAGFPQREATVVQVQVLVEQVARPQRGERQQEDEVHREVRGASA